MLRAPALLPAFLLIPALAPAQPPVPYKTGVDSTYVHRINVLDRDGNLLDAASTAPYSPARTCGKCHDYDRISMGRHFQAGFPGVADGRPGEPWLLWEPFTGTQVPLSHRAWAEESRRRPSDFGLTDWEFALRFGRHHPGGGPLEWLSDGRRRDQVEEADPAAGPDAGADSVSHWRAAGAIEVDCLLCHAATGYSTFDRHYYMDREESFRWAPTAAAGLGVVRGNVKDLRGFVQSSPDFTPRPPEGPVVRYDPSRFDPDGRVTFDITRHPPAKNCLYCHATRFPGAEPSFPERDVDVHLALGMTCTTCHRNDIRHEITRGDGGAEDLAHSPGNATLSCRGCHEEGRLGAPGIEHAGLPAFHLETLSCTACHSGPLPREPVPLVQTSRAHGLGQVTFEDLDEKKRPAVQTPFFQKDPDGVIRPHYAAWPAYWAEVRDGRLIPIPLPQARDAIAEVRLQVQEEIRRKTEEGAKGKSPEDAAADIQKALNEWRDRPAADRGGVETPRILAMIKERRKAEVAYVAGGRVYREEGGRLTSGERPEALPEVWPLAHNVRGAGQALGAKGCSDCHGASAAFFFARPHAEPPGPDGQQVSEPMHKYLGMKRKAIQLGAVAVKMRESFTRRASAWLVLAVLALSLLHYLTVGRRAATVAPAPQASEARPAGGPLLRWAHFSAFVLFVALAVTGAGFILTYGSSTVRGFLASREAVKLHAFAGLPFAALAVVLAVAWAASQRTRAADWLRTWGGFVWMCRRDDVSEATPARRRWVWFDALCCLAVGATGILMAARSPGTGRLLHALHGLAEHPLLGPAAYALHGLAATALLLRLAGHAYAALARRRRR